MEEGLRVLDLDEDHIEDSTKSLQQEDGSNLQASKLQAVAQLKADLDSLQQARQDAGDRLRDLKVRFGKFQVDSFVPLQGTSIADEHCRLSVVETTADLSSAEGNSEGRISRTNSPHKRAQKFAISISCMSPTAICRKGQVLHRGGGVDSDYPQLFRGISYLDSSSDELVHGDVVVMGEAIFVYLQPGATTSNLAWSDLLRDMHSQQNRRHASAVKLQRWFRCCDRNRLRPILLADDDQEIETDNVYVMYHGTPSLENAALIEQNGFRPSAGGLLGPGVYVSRDVRKAERYRGSGVILEVLVRVGKVCHLKPGPVPVPVGTKWKEWKAVDPTAKQAMKEAKDLVAKGWTHHSPWHEAGYDTAW